jgi:hypothetical protein
MHDRLTATTFAPLTKFTADVAWTYNASANLLTDAFLSFAGNVTPRAATISEILSNGVTLSLNAPGATAVTNAATFAGGPAYPCGASWRPLPI